MLDRHIFHGVMHIFVIIRRTFCQLETFDIICIFTHTEKQYKCFIQYVMCEHMMLSIFIEVVNQKIPFFNLANSHNLKG